MCDLKAAQMNRQRTLIEEIMLYELELNHKTVEATSNICFAKDVDVVHHNTVTT